MEKKEKEENRVTILPLLLLAVVVANSRIWIHNTSNKIFIVFIIREFIAFSF